jgi:uncharacterized NAD(P)/FAD-binding protein YdhS
VAIVGCGFSGTMVALHLARLAGDSLRVLIFERGERLARGAAYGTSNPDHLLNVPARLMSAWPDEPDHFLNWLTRRDTAYLPGSFAPRALYGDYLDEQLQGVVRKGSSVIPCHADIHDLIPEPAGKFTLVDTTQLRFEADAVVLAMGNLAPQDPIVELDKLLSNNIYVNHPWTGDPLRDLKAKDRLVLIGSGLTAVDLIIEALARESAGQITAISRHGLFPQAHLRAPGAPYSLPPFDKRFPRRAATLLRQIRIEVKQIEARGGDWRSVIDALRPEMQSLWKSMSAEEQRRFLRHLVAFWDVHRHRVAPEIHDRLERARRMGRLRLLAARITGVTEHEGGVHLVVRRRGHRSSESLFARRLINCTGPARDIRLGCPPLISALLRRKIACADQLSMGLKVEDKGRMIRGDGSLHEAIFALGPVLKGQLWETTAVRELRQQAAAIAQELVSIFRTTAENTVPRPHFNLVRQDSSESKHGVSRIFV